MNLKRYAVIDADGNVSWDVKREAGETFSNFEAAEKRAAGIAESEPGREVGIYEMVAKVSAPVGATIVKSVGRRAA